jgi:hypothetical protein
MRTPSLGEISQTSIAPGQPHAQDGSEVGDRRLPSNPSLPLNLSRGGERRWSNAKPPNSDVFQPSSFDAGGLSIRGINEGREGHPNRRPRDVHGAVAGRMAVHHHKSSLLKKFPLSAKAESKLDLRQDEQNIQRAARSQITGHMQVSISELQRMRLRKLQIKLVRQAIQMHYSTDEEAEGWEETLQQYGNVPRIIQSYI